MKTESKNIMTRDTYKSHNYAAHLLKQLFLATVSVLICCNTLAANSDVSGNIERSISYSSAASEGSDAASKLDCAKKVYSLPNVRFMHKVRPVDKNATVTVIGLPNGLIWNPMRQLVEGTVKEEGQYTYKAVIDCDGERTVESISLTVSSSLQLPRPFMGWLSWNSVQGDVSEAIAKQVADLLVEKGLYDCGWKNVMLDDLWQAPTRAADGSPQANAERFPNGIKAVSDYVHSRGMKFGIYTDAAEKTCAGAFGTYKYETIDANEYAKWGVDIVKCDYCYAPIEADTARIRYTAIADAFRNSGRNIALYVCEWGDREPWKWGAEAGGVCWRVSGDVRDCWRGKDGGVGVVQSIEKMKGLSNWQGVNRWNDADMLCTGLHGTGKASNDLCDTPAGMTQDEYRTQFALWCMWSSPMALSFDPRQNSLTDEDLEMLRNTEMIAINQDSMGQQADVAYDDGAMIVFAKDCENRDVVLSFTNLTDKEKTQTLDFAQIPHLNTDLKYTCRDVWQRKDIGTVDKSMTVTVGSHATQVFRLSLIKQH